MLQLWSLVEEGIPTLGAAPTKAYRRSVSEANLKDLKVKNYLFKQLIGRFLKQYWTRAHHRTYGNPCSRNIRGPQGLSVLSFKLCVESLNCWE